jgi:hypothetical protein
LAKQSIGIDQRHKLKGKIKMTKDINALRAALNASKASADNTTKSKSNTGDNASYPFWDIAEGTTATIRFLPDADPTNDFFWVNREVIKLPFSGIVGGEYPTDRDVTVTVPCIDMFGMKCPIIAATRHLWNDEATKPLARLYYKKRSYIFQGFVVNSPLVEDNVPENPIRRFVINKSVYDKVYDAIIDPEMEDMPTDFEAGSDFLIKKTKKGEWANYDTSKFSNRTRSLTEAERAAIDQYGLFDLKEALGAIPSSDHIAAMSEMLKDSMEGKPFDMVSYGNFYRPYTPQGNGGGNTQGATNTPRETEDVAPVVAQSVDPKVQDAKAVLANLRLRTNNG